MKETSGEEGARAEKDEGGGGRKKKKKRVVAKAVKAGGRGVGGGGGGDDGDGRKKKKRAVAKAGSDGSGTKPSQRKKGAAGSARPRPAGRPKTRAARTRGGKPHVRHGDRHTVHATKEEAEGLRSRLVQYMDSGGYVSWSAKKRRYMILGTNSAEDGLAPCPSCGVGQLRVIRSPKSGKRFMGCSNFYGGCDASSPLLQKARLRATKKACKTCGWPEVIFRYSSKQKWTRQCSNIACPTRSSGAQ